MGKKIENYCLENVIGEGEFGQVYKAVNQKTDQVVAIKMIKIEKYRVSPRLQQFTINEIQTLSKIEDTTHIVKFIEILKTANHVYFVYEFCNGGTLENVIKQHGHFVEEKAFGYLKDLLKAFKMLVKNNIMHRDIKPSNILLHNGIIKLADFGFCKPLKDARDLSQTMLGSPIYMAPQILKGQLYTINADIWSLGVVLYEMLFGYCPFEERNIARLIDLIDSSSSITFPSQIKISRKTEQLLKRMLIKDHFKRISWQELFEYDLTVSLEPEKMQRGKSPFMKKHFSSTNNNTPNTENNALLAINYSTKNYQDSGNNKVQPFKKNQSSSNNSINSNNNSSNSNNNSNNNSNSVQNQQIKIIKPLMNKRNKMKKGITFIYDLLKQSNSKLTVYLSCYISRKVRQHITELEKDIKRTQADKQNFISAYEIKKTLNILSEQITKISEKISYFEQELKFIKQPQDILYMRYAEEENMVQDKDGLIRLLEIDNYLYPTNETKDYSKFTKKQLREEYETIIVKAD